jgi:hypothetical protein
MARRRRRSQLGSATSVHAKQAASTQDAAIYNARQALRAVEAGDCKEALVALMEANNFSGKSAAHARSAGGTYYGIPEVGDANLAFSRKCVR